MCHILEHAQMNVCTKRNECIKAKHFKRHNRLCVYAVHVNINFRCLYSTCSSKSFKRDDIRNEKLKTKKNESMQFEQMVEAIASTPLKKATLV